MRKMEFLWKRSKHLVRLVLSIVILLTLATTVLAVDFASDFTSLADLQKAARKLNAEIAADSVTLLKNIGETLPLAKGDKVTVLGVFADQEGTSSSSGFAYGGQGSGNGTDPLGYVSLHDGLEMAGLIVNPTVKAYYASPQHGGVTYSRPSGNVPNTAAQTELRGKPTGWTTRNNSFSKGEEKPTGDDGNGNLETVKSSFADYKDAALIVLRRTGTEGGEYSLFNTPGHSNPLDHYYQPDDNELALIDYAASHFDKVIVLVNSANAMQLTDVEDNPNVDAILWIGYPGGSGNIGVGRVIAGEVSPSGRTVDLYNVDIKTDPAWQNFAGNIQTHLRVEKRVMREQINGVWVEHEIDVAVTQEDPWTFSGANVNLKTGPLVDIVPADGTNGTMGYRGRPTVEHYSRITDMNGNLNMPQAVTFSTNSSMANLLDYEEGIYLGYRFYETAYHEGYFDGTGVDGGKFEREEAGYYNRTDGVLYPFGYGLSYTTFTQEIVNKNQFAGKSLNTSDKSVMEVQVKVTNTGKVAGKEAVQLYLTAPYTPGGIEKAYVSMIAFGKTGVIKPGKSEIITLSFEVQSLASFDWNDANKDGHKGYELDPGTYTFRLQANSHVQIDSFDMTLANIVHYDYDSVTGAKVIPLFSPDDGQWDGTRNDPDYYSTFRNNFVTPDSSMVLMTRANFAGTFPLPPTKDDLKFSDEAIKIMDSQAAYTSFNDLTTDPWYMAKEDVPANWTQASAAEVAARVGGKTAIQLWDMRDVPFDDPRWDDFINQLSWNEFPTLINNSSTNPLPAIGLPQHANADGPGAFPNAQNGGSGGGSGTHWIAAANLAATFDVKNAEAVGRMEGNHSLWNGAQGWYGPGLQMHRVANSGRNFEYFAQDPLLTGLMGAYQVKGATSTGTIVYMKHLLLNEQETSRYSLHTFADEQTIREIYARAFEWAIKMGGDSVSTMSSYPSSGLVHPTANYNLYEKLLHDEWGLNQHSITDYFNNDNTLTTADMATRSNQVPLNSWQTNFGRNIDGVWDEEKNTVVVTMSPGGSYNPQNVNAGASRAYWNQETHEPAAKIYMDDAAALEDGFVPVPIGATLDAYTQWAAYRNLIHRVLYTKVNSNTMMNGLVNAPWSSTSTTTIYAPLGLESKYAFVNGDIVPDGVDVHYILSSGMLPEGLTLNKDGSITGITKAEGVYSFSVRGYAANAEWAGLGNGNNSYAAHNFNLVVEPYLLYDGPTQLTVGVPVNATFSVNPHFFPLPTLPANSGQTTYEWATGVTATPATGNVVNAPTALPAGLTLSAFDEETATFTLTGTPTTPVLNKVAYIYFGYGSKVGTGAFTFNTKLDVQQLSFNVAGNYNFNHNFEDSTDVELTFNPGDRIRIPSPSREGFIFAGWFTDAAGTNPAPKVAGSADNSTFYAKWIDINNTEEALTSLSQQIAELVSAQHDLYDEFDGRLEDVAADIAALQAQAVSLVSQLNNVLSRINLAEIAVDQIPGIIDAINEINGRLEELEEVEVVDYSQVIADLEDRLDAADLRFAAIEKALADAQKALEKAIEERDVAAALALANAISLLEEAIGDGNDELALTMAGHINDLTALITAAQNKANAADEKAEAADAKAIAADEKAKAADAKAIAADEKAKAADAKVEAAQKRIDEFEDALAALGTTIKITSVAFITISAILGILMVIFIKKRKQI